MNIIISHTNLDFDGLASMIAAKKLHKEAKLVFTGNLNKNVKEFVSLHKDALQIEKLSSINLSKIQKIIIVDTNDPSRLGKLSDIINKPNLSIIVYDHHPFNNLIKPSKKIIKRIGSTVTILIKEIIKKHINISKLEATIMALGIYEDTLYMTTDNTHPEDLEALAFLLRKGANLRVVSEFIKQPFTLEQKLLYESLKKDNRIIKVNEQNVLIGKSEFDYHIYGLNIIAQKLLEIHDVSITILIVKMKNKIYITTRSNTKSIDLNKFLKEFNGGGHTKASSAVISDSDIKKVYKKVIELLDSHIKPNKLANDIMSSPVKTIGENATINEANMILLKYGHTGIPIVDKGKIIGVISRRDIDKAKHHGLGHAPVKGFMSDNVITISSDLSIDSVKKIMIKNNIGRLPVIKNNELIGIVTRTDLLKELHGSYSPELNQPKNLPNSTKGLYEKQKSNYNIKQRIYKLPADILTLIETISKCAKMYNIKIYLVGGIVRDLLLDKKIEKDIDLVIEGNIDEFVNGLNVELGYNIKSYNKFGTATVFNNKYNIDVAIARREFYEYPAALPEVEKSNIKHDLNRRDFTINALAISLNDDNFGELIDYFNGLSDLYNKKIKVLHNFSFIEDPSRIIRAFRFKYRLGFEITISTNRLINDAIRSDVFSKLSFDRIKDELTIILKENDPFIIFKELNKQGVLVKIFPEVSMNQKILNSFKSVKKAILFIQSYINDKDKIDYNFVILVILASNINIYKNLYLLCKKFNLSKKRKDNILNFHMKYFEFSDKLCDPKLKTSETYYILNNLYKEEIILLLINSSFNELLKQRIDKFYKELKTLKLDITGEDLKTSLNLEPGPIYRKVLKHVFDKKLNGKINTKNDELLYAKEIYNNLIEKG